MGKNLVYLVTAVLSLFEPFITPNLARAESPFPSQNYSIQGGVGPISNTTISQDWLAWDEGANINVLYRPDTEIQYVITNSGEASNPNLDGTNVVYQEGGDIKIRDLGTMSETTIYSARSGEVCSNPKINGDNVVFKVTKNSRAEIWAYSLEEEMVFPITNSSNPKGVPDIYGDYVVWPERVDKENSLENLVYGDWDIKGYNLSTGLEFDINNDPDYSSGSCAIFGNIVAYSMNTTSDGPTGLQVYYLDTQDIRDTIAGPMGKIYDLALNGNILSWTRTPPSAYGGTDRNRIEAVRIESGVSPGFTVNVSNGVQSGSDTFKHEDGSAVVSYAESDLESPNQGTIEALSANGVEDEKSRMVSSELMSPLEAKLGYLSKHWLKKGGDITGDGIFNFEDYAKLFANPSTEE